MTNTEIVHQWLDQFWQNGDITALERWVAPDGVCHGLADGDPPVMGPEDFRHYAQNLMTLFTSMKIDIDASIEQGEHFVARCTVRATTESGRPVTFGGMCWVTIRNQKIVEAWNRFDTVKMVKELEAG